MKQTENQYIFGPVPSRRLGMSLGIDAVPFKTCSYDCIYCQLGRTTNKTVKRSDWVPLETILQQLRHRLDELQTPPDTITLSGSGEPSLYSRMDELIDGIQAISSIPIAVLTNGSLFWKREVREQVKNADLIIPSLDAGNEALFHYVNRPHQSISFSTMAEGLVALRREFPKQFWLEIFLLGGHSTVQSEIEDILQWVERIQPDRVQLNTVIRPPAEDFAYTVPRRQLQEIAKMFHPAAEVIAEYQRENVNEKPKHIHSDILSILQRRPCTLNDLSRTTSLHPNELLKYLDNLISDQQIKLRQVEGKSYYSS